MSRHILFDISGHGFGHLAQTSQVINALHARFPDWKVTIRTSLPRALIETRVACDFDLINHSTDFGMLMDSALDVDKGKSLSRYRSVHQQLDQQIEEEKNRLSRLKPDLLFSNIPYVSIAAANVLRIPVVAMCSLNWGDILRGYCDDMEGIAISHQIIECYSSAKVFLRPEPSMDMPQIKTQRAIRPLAGSGNSRRDELLRQFPVMRDRIIVLVAPGGIPTQINVDQWPHNNRLMYLTSWGVRSEREDVVDLDELPYRFLDILSSVDVLLTKVGYGMFAEAMCNRVPMLYVRRMDWPEEPFLVEWAEAFGKVLEVPRERLFDGDVMSDIEGVLAKPWSKPRPNAGGESQAVEAIVELVS